MEDKTLEKEYEAYRKSLSVFKECPACHYIQGLLLFGGSLFSASRMHFLWNSLRWKDVAKYITISAVTTLVGTYKVTYAYHIYKYQDWATK